jgi:hypothetical protein
MAGEITYLKGTSPGHWPKGNQEEGAYYYVQGGSVATYKKASVLITLPTSKRLRKAGSDWGRNAYISLGVDGGSAGPIDIGLRNPSRFGEKEPKAGQEAPTDQGYGWEAVCYECSVDKLHTATPGSANKAPAGTTKAKVDIRPNPNGRSITLYVEWLNGNNVVLSSYLETFTLSKTYNWTVFYRFASLVTTNPNASMSDSTFMVGGTFETAKLGDTSNTNWGISSTPVTKAWIVNPPKCSVPTRWDVGEQFKIDHWA